MNLKNKKFYYAVLSLVLLISVLGFYLFFQESVEKTKKINYKINNEIKDLKILQKNINENIDKIKTVTAPPLRYGFSFNESRRYFISKILDESKEYFVKLDYVKLKYSKKNKSIKIYAFKIAGKGRPRNIYLFIKALEYNDKFQFSKLLIKRGGEKDAVLFRSDLLAQVIKKSDVLKVILKNKQNLVPPPHAPGIIDTFNIPIIQNKQTHIIKSQNIKQEKIYPPKRINKEFKIKAKIYKKVFSLKSYEKNDRVARLRESDYYNRKGVSFFVQKDYSLALKMFKKALTFNPLNYQALSNAALDNYEKKDYNTALFYAKKAVRQKNIWQTNFILGLIYLHKGKYLMAEPYFRQAHRLEPSNAKISYYLNVAEKGL